ncbi:endoplasmic reticulum lectin 1-like [Glandiceps talaboti]
MTNFTECTFILCLYSLITHAFSSSFYGGFNTDETVFRLEWPGHQTLRMEPGYRSEEVIMKTADNEEYRCLLPLSGDDEGEQDGGQYTGPTAEELMDPLYKQLSCSYRIEAYWNYELCHGKHLRQYHEEKEAGKNTKLQEYFLGKVTESEEESTDEEETPEEVPTKKIDGRDVAYYEVVMDGGTPCDLKQNQPRKTRVLYICDPGSKHDIYSLDEISTCEYEIIVLTPNLCSNPVYKLKETAINEIQCQPISGSPSKPKGLLALESEGSKAQFSSHNLKPPKKSVKDSPIQQPKEQPVADFADKQLLRDFLAGEYCLYGGQGWWKYEFCYGKYARQYHVEKTGRTEIKLGSWNEQEHREWFRKFKKTKGQKSVYLFYGHGDVCDLTGKERQVQVKLKCKESQAPHSVSIYLVEPTTCEYILGVESPLICALLKTADDDGILHPIIE